MNTGTNTQTYSRTDIQRVFENFSADLKMLANRTQAMPKKFADDVAHDVMEMARHECLARVSIHLLDVNGILVKAHEYCVGKNVLWDAQRPGVNMWPCLPGSELLVIVAYSDNHKAEDLMQSNSLKENWVSTSISTDYSHMKKDGERTYSSNSYGLHRKSYTA